MITIVLLVYFPFILSYGALIVVNLVFGVNNPSPLHFLFNLITTKVIL